MKKKLMKLEGIGKYPYIRVKLCSGRKTTSVPQSRRRTETLTVCETPVTSSPVHNTSVGEEMGEGKDDESGHSFEVVEVLVDFGEVTVGSVVKRKMELTNASPVSIVCVHCSVHSSRFLSPDSTSSLRKLALISV